MRMFLSNNSFLYKAQIRGLEEAKLLASTKKLDFPFDRIYASPLERAVQTGEIVTGLQRTRKSFAH